MKKLLTFFSLLSITFSNSLFATEQPSGADPLKLQDDATITTPSFELPFSSFASPQARDATVTRMRSKMPSLTDLESIRKITNQQLLPIIESLQESYPHKSDKVTMAGVPVEVFVPADGVSDENRNRVLIELHGGAFIAGGGGPMGAVESIPIAVTAGIKVIAVDYRQGPEHRFPAASEDVAKVYRELLKEYRPENIGIYGCSAGGMLSAQSVAWFQQETLPAPGAIGVFCASLHTFDEGDSAQLWPRMGSVLSNPPPLKKSEKFDMSSPYFAGVSKSNPLAVPAASKQVLAEFPPTLFLTGTRAPEMSGAAQSHLDLRLLGVESELILFDGMDHGFFNDPTLPESRDAYRLIADFFAKHLGNQPVGQKAK